MYSVWKKLTGKQDDKPSFPTGVAPIGETMQKKYAKGVQYNMKIILKGDRNTGKSSLFRRLNGKSFVEEYIPTHEIQVTNVNWNYQGAADIVKVEVWDIVDKSEKRKGSAGDSLKITNDNEEEDPAENSNSMALDAEFLNVYKGTHGVILTLDITKQWTWTYVQRELEKIPCRIPVLILGNFRDVGEHRVVQTDEIIAYIEHLDRPTGSAEVYFTESSMKDGYGLHYAYKFFNMPFLILQRETLLKQLEANTLEIEETRESLHIHSVYEEGSYSNFQELLAKKERQSTEGEKVNGEIQEKEENIANTEPATCPEKGSSENRTVNGNAQSLPPLTKLDIAGKSLPVATVSPTVHSVESPKESIFKAYSKKIFGGDKPANKEEQDDDDAVEETDGNPAVDNTTISPIGDFNAGNLSSDFLDSTSRSHSKPVEKNQTLHDSDDEEDSNPMVAGYVDMDEPVIEKFDCQSSSEDDDGEFEDLSDDERRQLEEPAESIIEKIKSERTSVMVTNGDSEYCYLDSDAEDENPNVSCEQLDVEDETDYVAPVVEAPPAPEIDNDVSHTPVEPPTEKRDSIVEVNGESGEQNETLKTVESDEEEDEDEPVYVIAGDLDVEDVPSWLVHDSPDHEVKQKPSTSSKNNSSVQPAPSEDLNFELDDLEMFMNNQMVKKTITDPVGVSSMTDSTSTDESRPKKKKKKKKTESEEGTPTNTEKKKKKKTVSADVSTESPSSDSTTKKTRKSKTPSEKEKKTSTEKEKTKKKKKKEEKTELSELDSFYEGL